MGRNDIIRILRIETNKLMPPKDFHALNPWHDFFLSFLVLSLSPPSGRFILLSYTGTRKFSTVVFKCCQNCFPQVMSTKYKSQFGCLKERLFFYRQDSRIFKQILISLVQINYVVKSSMRETEYFVRFCINQMPVNSLPSSKVLCLRLFCLQIHLHFYLIYQYLTIMT